MHELPRYTLAALDSRDFYGRLRAEWLTAVCGKYQRPDSTARQVWTPVDAIVEELYNPTYALSDWLQRCDLRCGPCMVWCMNSAFYFLLQPDYCKDMYNIVVLLLHIANVANGYVELRFLDPPGPVCQTSWQSCACSVHATQPGCSPAHSTTYGYQMLMTTSPTCSHYPSHLHIDLLPRAQGKGNGRALMTTLLTLLRSRGSTGVHLEMAPTNVGARTFYEKLGFAAVDPLREGGAEGAPPPAREPPHEQLEGPPGSASAPLYLGLQL